jgi:hypothetical protein
MEDEAMTPLDWIIAIGAVIAAAQMKSAFRFKAFEDEQRRRRPKAHNFG